MLSKWRSIRLHPNWDPGRLLNVTWLSYMHWVESYISLKAGNAKASNCDALGSDAVWIQAYQSFYGTVLLLQTFTEYKNVPHSHQRRTRRPNSMQIICGDTNLWRFESKQVCLWMQILNSKFSVKISNRDPHWRSENHKMQKSTYWGNVRYH